MDTSTRLRGHGLLSEGKPYFFRQGDKQDTPSWHRADPDFDGQGHGVCSCGAASPELETDGQRKRWHKAHKDEIRTALDPEAERLSPEDPKGA